MTHRFVTITIPFATHRAAAVDAVLDRMGNPPSPATRAALDTAGIVHFMSITAVRDTAPGRAHLVIEASTDLGGTDPVVSIADALGTEFQCLFAAAGIAYRQPTLAAFLASQDLRIGGLWSQTAGLGFDGSPGMSVRRIRAEAALAERITTEMGGVLASAMPARDKLQKVRDWAWQNDQKWAFSAEATPFLFGGKARTPIVVATLAAITAAQLGWPLLVVPIVLMLLAGIPLGLLITLVLLVAVAALGLMELRQLEAANTPNDTAPDAARLGEVLRRENLGAQNLLAACSTMQAGWFRRFTLRVAFCMVTLGASRVYRPGYLRTIAVIHFARWVMIPGTDKLLFYSNFSDTWESYLEDFISKAADGLTAVWSNTVGFPRARFLFGGGAADGDRFRRWARRQQMPVLFWYCAYPTLKAPRIRLNAAIRRGLADARTDAEAEDWLSCFGSVPRAPFELQKPEIQTLLFGGLSRLRYSAGVILSFDGAPKAARAWLASVADRITYAEHVASDHAMTVAFSATGLTKLGLAAEDLATFSVAFQQGMTVPWRARLLGDEGNQAPESWLWGAADTTDALVYLFARDEAGLTQAMATLQSGAQAHGHRVVFQQVMKPLPPHGQVYEPFGFADGVSQPVLRDTPRARVPRNAGHVVDAGEFVLGYPDLRGYLPPTSHGRRQPRPGRPAAGIRGRPERDARAVQQRRFRPARFRPQRQLHGGAPPGAGRGGAAPMGGHGGGSVDPRRTECLGLAAAGPGGTRHRQGSRALERRPLAGAPRPCAELGDSGPPQRRAGQRLPILPGGSAGPEMPAGLPHATRQPPRRPGHRRPRPARHREPAPPDARRTAV